MDFEDWAPIPELAASVKSGKTSALSMVIEALERVDKAQEKYNAVILTLKDAAEERARAIDKQIVNGEDPGPLAGIPFIAKDNFLVFGGETKAASKILSGFMPPYQATAIEALTRNGAICVAKANMDAFAHGASTENSDYGVTKNPYDPTRVAGGSSGGSAAAVALNLTPFALGTDTGGSIRQPAAFCGVVGLKPTYGLVSRSGVIAMGSSLDCIGPLAKRVSDAAIVLDIISGKDPLDSTTIAKDDKGYADIKPATLKGLKIGVISEYLDDQVDEGVKRALLGATNWLKDNGAQVSDVSLPSTKLALACYYIICPAEVSSNLGRYDGIRYGFTDKTATDLNSSYLKSRGHGFGKEAKRRIMMGTFVLSSGYYDAYYKKAMTVRTKIINEFADAFSKLDILIGPVAPTTAFKIGERTKDPLKMYLADVMTVAANLAGIPAIALPFGKDENGLPIGLQLMSAQAQDHQLLSVAMTLEQAEKELAK